MNSYGKFKNFEIRDICRLNEEYDSAKNRRFDLVKWDNDNSHCWSIANIEWDSHEFDFELHSIGMRYAEDSTEELNKWLLKWCELKKFEYSSLDSGMAFSEECSNCSEKHSGICYMCDKSNRY